MSDATSQSGTITHATSAAGPSAFSRKKAARVRPDSFLVHSHLRWDFVWQRPQQIFSRLARSHPVLFIEDPLPAADGQAPSLELSEPWPNVVRAVPRLPDGAAQGVDAECELLAPLIRKALAREPLPMSRSRVALTKSGT